MPVPLMALAVLFYHHSCSVNGRDEEIKQNKKLSYLFSVIKFIVSSGMIAFFLRKNKKD